MSAPRRDRKTQAHTRCPSRVPRRALGLPSALGEARRPPPQTRAHQPPARAACGARAVLPQQPQAPGEQVARRRGCENRTTIWARASPVRPEGPQGLVPNDQDRRARADPAGAPACGRNQEGNRRSKSRTRKESRRACSCQKQPGQRSPPREPRLCRCRPMPCPEATECASAPVPSGQQRGIHRIGRARLAWTASVETRERRATACH